MQACYFRLSFCWSLNLVLSKAHAVLHVARSHVFSKFHSFVDQHLERPCNSWAACIGTGFRQIFVAMKIFWVSKPCCAQMFLTRFLCLNSFVRHVHFDLLVWSLIDKLTFLLKYLNFSISISYICFAYSLLFSFYLFLFFPLSFNHCHSHTNTVIKYKTQVFLIFFYFLFFISFSMFMHILHHLWELDLV